MDYLLWEVKTGDKKTALIVRPFGFYFVASANTWYSIQTIATQSPKSISICQGEVVVLGHSC